jgi:WD40 repeat protein
MFRMIRVGLAMACVLAIGCNRGGTSGDGGPNDGLRDTVGSADQREAPGVDAIDGSSDGSPDVPGDAMDAADAPVDVDATDGDTAPLVDWSMVRPCGVFGWFPAVSSVAFSADGHSVALGGLSAALFDATSGVLNRSYPGLTGAAAAVALSPDGQLVAAVGSGGGCAVCAATPPVQVVIVWRVADGSVAWSYASMSSVQAVAFSPDGTLLAFAAYDRSVHVVDASTGAARVTYTGHQTPVASLAFAPDGQTIASGDEVTTVGQTATIRIWRVSDAGTVSTFQFPGTVQRLAISPDGTQLLASTGSSAVRLKTSDGTQIGGSLPIGGGVAFAPDGQSFFAGGVLYRTSDGSQYRQLAMGVTDAAYSPDSSQILVAPTNAAPFLWSVNTGAVGKSFQGTSIDASIGAVSPDGQRVLFGASMFSLVDGQPISTYAGPAGGSFSPDGTLLAAGSGNDVVLRAASDGSLVATLKGHAAAITALAFSPDGTMLASGSADLTIMVWKVPSGDPIRTLGGVAGGPSDPVISVAWSPDGASLLGGGSKSYLWRVSDGAILHAFPNESGGQAAFSPDGAQVLTWNQDMPPPPDAGLLAAGTGVAQLWDVQTYAPELAFTGCPDLGYGAQAFSVDGTIVASGCNIETLLWSRADAHLVAPLVFPDHANWATFTAEGVLVANVSVPGQMSGRAVYWCRRP